MPSRKYGVFNIKMTNTMKEGNAGTKRVAGALTVRARQTAVRLSEGVGLERESCHEAPNKQGFLSVRSGRSEAPRIKRAACKGLGAASLISCHLAGSSALAQAAVSLCLPPELPVTALPEAVLAEYRAEISAEFEAYFAEVSDYIACLDAERGRAMTEARDAVNTYSAFLETTPEQKDLP